ncbi:hypothetical protein CFC21_103878 [Triticum aestivum]|uniref:Uncharacterized protein n=3 Tax=Triticum TaxID=4564 RepID=A0A9R1A6E3_TRITD|nr:uncharacterized protein LOC123161190 [Triticum aestivum]KAF7102810.1 hypothetical protein CFC21_103878 [Triticum aestivum]VAI89969.1 unnamed protein product [Triticum turgidum subsp. durum]
MDSLPPPPSLPPFGSLPSLPWPDLVAGAAGATLRLVSAHSRHFLALSCLLLPLSLLLLSLPTPFPGASPSVSLRSPQDSWSNPLLLLALVTALLYLAAFAAAAASAHAGFFGRPVKLLASLISVPASVLRLLLTALPASPLLLIPLLPLPAEISTGIALLGVSLLAPFWSLAGAAAIVESTAGPSALRQSCRLLSGARLAALSAFLVLAAGIGVVLWGFSGVAMETYDAATGWAGMAPAVVKAMVGTAMLAAMMLYGMVINVVLYMHCRALHGELTGEIYNEFASSYVYLPFDEGKDRHIVSVVTLWP